MRMRTKAMSIFLALAAAALMCGCQDAKADLSAGEDPAQVSGTENTGMDKYTSDQGWSLTYNADCFNMYEADGSVNFVYTGESAGTDMVTVTFIPDADPDKVINERTAGIDPSIITRSEGSFVLDDLQAVTAVVTAPEESSGLNEQLSAAEFRDGVLLFDIITHTEADENKGMAVSDSLAELIDSLEIEQV